MYIDENTKISKIINSTPDSIDAIVSLSKHFEKLKIPILRKTLASRVTIKQAAKIGGVEVQDFFEKLAPLGFTFNDQLLPEPSEAANDPKSKAIDFNNVIDLDVRDILRQNKDPFNLIMDTLEKLPDEYSLKIINTFDPIPLINILSKRGYIHQTIQVDRSLVHTYFKKDKNSNTKHNNVIIKADIDDSSKLLNNYRNKIKEIDVRDLEMPLPMSTILNELQLLPDNHLLFVHHKKVPKFLFPELAERGYQWHIQKLAENNVELYIFK